jgi:hypothetical protein
LGLAALTAQKPEREFNPPTSIPAGVLLVAGFVSIDLAIINRELQSPGNRKKVVCESYGWLC